MTSPTSAWPRRRQLGHHRVERRPRRPAGRRTETASPSAASRSAIARPMPPAAPGDDRGAAGARSPRAHGTMTILCADAVVLRRLDRLRVVGEAEAVGDQPVGPHPAAAQRGDRGPEGRHLGERPEHGQLPTEHLVRRQREPRVLPGDPVDEQRAAVAQQREPEVADRRPSRWPRRRCRSPCPVGEAARSCVDDLLARCLVGDQPDRRRSGRSRAPGPCRAWPARGRRRSRGRRRRRPSSGRAATRSVRRRTPARCCPGAAGAAPGRASRRTRAR